MNVCYKCKHTNIDSAKFCNECGSDLYTGAKKSAGQKIGAALLIITAVAAIVYIGSVYKTGGKESRPAAKTTAPAKSDTGFAFELTLSDQEAVSYAKDLLKDKGQPLSGQLEAMATRLLKVPKTSKYYQEAQALYQRVRDERILPPRRHNLALQYQDLLNRIYPNLNFITVPDYSGMLIGSHEYFTENTFKIGPQGRVVQEWVRENKSALEAAQISVVGIMNKGSGLGSCSFLVSTGELLEP